MVKMKDLPWTKLVAEGVLIVISILVAFGIDAWWDDRQRAAEEQELLQQLIAEFGNNRELLADRKARHQHTEHSARRILSRTGPEVSAVEKSDELIRQDFGQLLQWFTFDPQTGALDGAIQSGKLSVISSSELRSQLASWPAQFRDLAEDEVFVARFTRNSIDRVMQRTVRIRNVFAIEGLGPSAFPDDPTEVLSTPEFESVIVQKLAMTLVILKVYESLDEALEETLALMQEDIA